MRLLIAILALSLIGCAPKKRLDIVIPRECMGKAEFAAGKCQNISESLVRCTGVELVMPIYCVRAK